TGTAMFPGLSLDLSWPAFQQIHGRLVSLEQSAVCWNSGKTLTGQKEPLLLSVSSVTDEFFTELGTAPELGHLFSEEDFAKGHERVLVISDDLWRRAFGADSNIIGRNLVLDKQEFTVVGVTRRGFAFPEKTDAWTPLVLNGDEQQNPTFFAFQFLGKLRPGEHIERLNSELGTIADRIAKDNPQLRDGYTLSAGYLLELQVKDSRAAYLILLGAASFVLLIACVNLSSLLLARGTTRQHEMALRSAVGASKRRLLQQGLVESCVLAVCSGALGAVLAAWGVQSFRFIAPRGTPRLDEIAPHWTLLAFALGVSLLTGVLLGIAPALRGARNSLNEGLNDRPRNLASSVSPRQARFGSALITGEVALAYVLLIGAGLMLQTLTRLLHQSPGFRTDHLLTFDLPGPSIDQFKSREEWISSGVARLNEVDRQLRQVPGVGDVTATNSGILGGVMVSNGGLRIEGGVRPLTSGADSFVSSRFVSPTYFRTLGIPVLHGRVFDARDDRNRPQVALVNESFARRYWGTPEVLGKRISISTGDKGEPIWDEVIGVVADTRVVHIAGTPPPKLYFSLYQIQSGPLHLIMRTTVDPEALKDTARRAVWASFPDQPITHVMTMKRTIAESIGAQRMHAVLLGTFAAIGLSLVLLGVYGVVSYSVVRRTQEIGIRVALGAA
ncbi:MAG: hypothetical protein AUG75_10230, partial [Cyanobacteria bacterium 13_1_20CM_4_61_6]